MSQATDADDSEMADVTVTFSDVLTAIHKTAEIGSPVLDGDEEVSITVKGYDRERSDGDIDAALELIYAAPGFDNRVDPYEVEDALGNGLIATIETDERTIIATNTNFDASEAPSRENPPVTAGDLVPDNGVLVEMVDHPTGGPLVRTPEGTDAQLDDYGFLIVE